MMRAGRGEPGDAAHARRRGDPRPILEVPAPGPVAWAGPRRVENGREALPRCRDEPARANAGLSLSSKVRMEAGVEARHAAGALREWYGRSLGKDHASRHDRAGRR